MKKSFKFTIRCRCRYLSYKINSLGNPSILIQLLKQCHTSDDDKDYTQYIFLIKSKMFENSKLNSSVPLILTTRRILCKSLITMTLFSSINPILDRKEINIKVLMNLYFSINYTLFLLKPRSWLGTLTMQIF